MAHVKKLMSLLVFIDKPNVHKSYENIVAKQEFDFYALQRQVNSLKLQLKRLLL